MSIVEDLKREAFGDVTGQNKHEFKVRMECRENLMYILKDFIWGFLSGLRLQLRTELLQLPRFPDLTYLVPRAMHIHQSILQTHIKQDDYLS